MLTSRYTMDARNPAARREIAALADLAGALRLPGGAHQRAAGTGVVTDLLILRRREPGRHPDPTAWEQARLTEIDGAQIPVNEYFLDHPEAVLGELGAAGGTYRADDLTVTASGDTIAPFIRGLDRITASAAPAASPGPRRPPAPPPPAAAPRHRRTRMATCRPAPTARSPRSRTGTPIPFEVPSVPGRRTARPARLARHGRAPAGALRPPPPKNTPDTERPRAQLTRQYDEYVRAYGPLNRFSLRRTGRTDPVTGEPVMARVAPPQGGFRGDPYAPLVYALEEFDPAGQRAAKAAIFTHRVVAPRTPRLGADTAADALAICLDTHGEARLGRDRPAARRQRGPGPRGPRHAGLRRPAVRPAGPGRRVPVRQRPRQAPRRRAGRRGPIPGSRSNVAGLRAVIPRDLAPGGDRRPARRRLDRRRLCRAVPARDPR